MGNFESAYKAILHRIHATRRKENSIIFLSSLLKALSFVILLALAVISVEAIAHGDTLFRTILAGAFFAGSIAGLTAFLYKPVSRLLGISGFESDSEVALRIGGVYGDVRDNLCNAIQLVPIVSNPRGMSPDLVSAAFEQVWEQTNHLDFDAIINKEKIKRNGIIFLLSIALFGGTFFAANPAMGDSAYRIMNYGKSFIPPAPFSLKISPLKDTKLRGESAIITITATGTAPESIRLKLKEESQQNYDSYTLKSDSAGHYKFEMPSLKNSISFFAEADWMNTLVVTEIGSIKIIDRPIIRSISGRLVFPSYTALGTKEFTEQNADIAAIRGTQANFEIIANKDIDSAKIVFERKSVTAGASGDSAKTEINEYKFKSNGRKISGGFRVAFSGVYYVRLYDKAGLDNEDPIKYSVIAFDDADPKISLLQPQTNVTLGSNAILPLETNISDDYGFSSLKLYYRLAESPFSPPEKNFHSIEIPISKNQTNQDIPYVWDLNKLSITPEDKYEFYLEVFDNDVISGPKSAKTQTLTVRLPSMDEVLTDNKKEQANIEQNLDKVLKEAKDLKKDIEELQRDLMKNNEAKQLNWKEQKKAEDIMKRQEDLAKKMDDLQKDIQESAKKLDDHNMISQETLERYQELQNLMKQVNSPELKKMQERMQQAMNQMTPEELKKAMDQFKFNEEQFKQSIERTMKLLKRIQAEQKTDAVQKMAEEISKKQDELSEQTKNANPNDKEKRDEISKKQDNLQKDMQSLEKETKDLENLMKEIGEDQMPMDKMDEAKNALNQNETESEMQQSKQSAQNGEMQKSSQSQKKASKNLSNFAQKMSEMKKQMQKNGTEEAIREMQKSANSLTELSKQQENVKGKTQNSDYNSNRIADYAEQQEKIRESLANVAQAMAKLSEKSFSVTPEMAQGMSEAMNEMQNSIEQLADRRTPQATKNQAGAMAAMNRTIGQMQDMLDAMRQKGNGSCNNPGGMGQGQGSGGSGMMPNMSQRLQQMAAQQQSVQDALQKMMGSNGMSSDGKMSMEQRAQMQRMTGDQGNAAKSAQDLAKEYKQFNSADKKTADNLGDIAKQMEEVVKDMQSGKVTQETMQKQEKILSRLLDAMNSVNDRDYEKRRESKSGKDFNLSSPGEIDLSTQEGRRHAIEELMKQNSKKYSKDYEILIKQYFDALQSRKD